MRKICETAHLPLILSKRAASERVEGRTISATVTMKRHVRSRSTEPSARQLRVGEEVRHGLARIFERHEMSDPALTDVTLTVTEVRMSPDLKHASVFVMPLAGAHAAEVLAGLKRGAPYLRGLVAREVALRFTPTLSFMLDMSFEHANRINEILHRPEVQRDVSDAAPRDPDDGAEGDGGA